MEAKKISIVIPVYNEEKCLKNNISVIQEYVEKYDYEIVLVDDGSCDNTWNIIKELHELNTRVKGVRFSRNFGKEIALCAGLEKSTGDVAITMDSDLQHDPKYIDTLIEEWSKGYKIVETERKARNKQFFLYKWFSIIFYKLLKALSGLDFNNKLDYKLLDRSVVSQILEMQEKNVYYKGLTDFVGHERKIIKVDIPERKGDKSKFKTGSLIKLATNAIINYSNSLLKIVVYIGIIFFVSSIIMGAHTLYNKFTGNAADGFTMVILLILILGSLLLLSLGIIGIYIGKIYDEVKSRPRYFISEDIK